MIQEIYLFTEAGLCLFSRGYKDEFLDKTIVSGFFSAIFSLAKSYSGEDEIQEIDIKKNIIYSKAQNSLVITVITDPNDNPKLIREIIERLLQQFLLRYKRDLRAKFLQSRTFKDFDAYIDLLLRKEGKITKDDFFQSKLREWVVAFYLERLQINQILTFVQHFYGKLTKKTANLIKKAFLNFRKTAKQDKKRLLSSNTQKKTELGNETLIKMVNNINGILTQEFFTLPNKLPPNLKNLASKIPRIF